MRALEDEIRDTLRSEAARLREVRPLYLPPADAGLEPQAASPVRWLRSWQAPAAAAAVILLVAAALVALKSHRNDHGGPAAGRPLPAGVPRYSMTESWVKDGADENGMGLAWVVTDAQTGSQAAYVPLPGYSPVTGPFLGGRVAAAADDRTFVAVEPVTRPGAATRTGGQTVQGLPVVTGLKWYLLRFSPGSADPLRLTPLSLPSTAAFGGIADMALTGDGTQLAVMYETATLVTLRVYSVATGQVRHSWAAAVTQPAGKNAAPIRRVTNLSWVGEATVGFVLTSLPDARADVHEEVRTVRTDAPGTSLLPASRVAWALDVPLAAYAHNGGRGTSQACNSPFLSGNGQVVVCGIATYSAVSRRLTTSWVAYPVADPARPRVLASILTSIHSVDVPTLSPITTVQWVNASGTEVIGNWSHQVGTNVGYTPQGHATGVYTSPGYTAVIGHGTIQRLPTGVGNDPDTAW